MNRDQILGTAQQLISTDRASVYGPYAEESAKIATLWSVVFGHEVSPYQVALCMTLLKIERLLATKGSHEDSWVDAAGYLALGGEVATEEIQ